MTVFRFSSFVLIACTFGLQPVHARPGSGYPKTLREIPREFRGSFDETGYCGRETRFRLQASNLFNFETSSKVLKVILTSPTDIVIHTRIGREHRDGGPDTDKWTFKLVETGDLAGSDGKPPYLLRCRHGQQ